MRVALVFIVLGQVIVNNVSGALRGKIVVETIWDTLMAKCSGLINLSVFQSFNLCKVFNLLSLFKVLILFIFIFLKEAVLQL